MRKVMLLLTAAFFLTTSYSATIVELPKLNANQILIPVGKTGMKISLMDLSKISMDNLKALTGKKMNFLERISFKIAQKKLSKNIASDGTIKNKKIAKFFDKRAGPDKGFHALGFFLGFILGLVGVLLAYVINDDEDKKNRVKWAWIGTGIWVVLWIILYAAVIAVSI